MMQLVELDVKKTTSVRCNKKVSLKVKKNFYKTVVRLATKREEEQISIAKIRIEYIVLPSLIESVMNIY